MSIEGFDCEFIVKPPSLFQSECPVCLLVLCEPYQVTCCGKSFCRVCIGRIKSENKPCPTCNAEKFADFPNKGLQQSLYQFKVFCIHQKQGCEWIGELGELDNHLNLDPQSDKQLEGCNYAEINCRYLYAGCTVRLPRNEMKVHDRKAATHHVNLLDTKCIQLLDAQKQNEAQISKVNSDWLQRIHQHFLIPPLTFTMKHFGYHYENSQVWFSPPFYTDIGGYKMCLQVDVGIKKCLSVKLCIMKGEFDDKIFKPRKKYKEEVEIQVVNKENVKESKSVVIYNANGFRNACRVKKGELSRKSFGTEESKSLIQPSDIEKFVANDSVEFCIKYAGPKKTRD